MLNGDETSMNRALIVAGRKLDQFFMPLSDKLPASAQISLKYRSDNEDSPKITSPEIIKVTMFTHDL